MLLTAAIFVALVQADGLNKQTPLYGKDYVLRRATLDSSEGPMTGGQFSLRGTAGQHDPGAHSGGQFRLSGGFWTPAKAEYGAIFADSFGT